MNARGERILIFGDSLTHVGSDNGPEINDNISSDPNPSDSAPGDVLASLLLQQGAAAVRTNSRVGRSAVNFFGREDTTGLFASDQAFAPTQVVVMLGTNDIGMSGDATSQAMTAIRDQYKAMGADVWAIGPMTYVGPSKNLNDGAGDVLEIMRDVFGSGHTIDARPLSVNVDRTNDGVHFQPTSAMQTGFNLADALISTNPLSLWKTIALGVGATAVMIAGVLWWKKHHGSGLAAISDEDFWKAMKSRKIPTSSTTPQPVRTMKQLRGKTNLWRRVDTMSAGSREPMSYRWEHVRDSDEENAEKWLAIFQRDEPNAIFAISAKKPKGKRGPKVMVGPGYTY